MTSLVALSGELRPTGSKGKELMKPDCKEEGHTNIRAGESCIIHKVAGLVVQTGTSLTCRSRLLNLQTVRGGLEYTGVGRSDAGLTEAFSEGAKSIGE